MNNIKDVLNQLVPGFDQEFPSKVISCAEALYQLSLRERPTLPNNSEIARSHVCGYVAVSKYHEQLDIPSPVMVKIPAPPKVAARLVDDFTDSLLNQLVSAASTPVSTPRRKRVVSEMGSPGSSPRKRQNTVPKNGGSPLKKQLQALLNEDTGTNNDDVPSTPTRNSKSKNSALTLLDYDKPSVFNDSNAKGTSPLLESLKKQQDQENRPVLPLKSGKATPTSSPSKIYVYDKKHVKIPDLITFCNSFFIPAKYTSKIVQAFLEHKHKFHKKTEWLLACGLVHAAYIRINNELLQSKMGAKASFQDYLFEYQKGGLIKRTMLSWCNIIEDAFKTEQWITDIELEYVYKNKSLVEANESREVESKLGRGWELFELMGSMVNATTVLDSDSQTEYYSVWTEEVRKQVQG